MIKKHFLFNATLPLSKDRVEAAAPWLAFGGRGAPRNLRIDSGKG
jgi:hypothetical protein